MEEKIIWNIGKPTKQKEYLVTLVNGYIDLLTYYPNDEIWMDDCDGGVDGVVSWAEKPKGYKPVN